MTKKDWYEAGDQIKNLVQDAIDNKDFSELSNTISNVVNETMNSVEEVLRDSLGKENAKQAHSRRTNTQDSRTEREAAYARRREAAERIRRSMEQNRDQKRNQNTDQGQNLNQRQNPEQNPKQNRDQKQNTAPVIRKMKVPGLYTGSVMKWTGYTLGSMFGLTFGILTAVGIAAELRVVMIPAGIMGVLFAGFMYLGSQGSEKLKLAKRFQRYRNVLGTRTFCLVEELAAAVGENSKFVRRDLKKMIKKGFFPLAYLDNKEQCLITDQETYRQYLSTQEAYVTREMASERAEQEEEKLPPECRELVMEGRNYIRHIHACNDQIADPVISEKLDRLEVVVTRIFTEAEKNPSITADLKKMMSYYLPTTKKLLDAYCELDAQPIQGPNIETTKKEIADTLDTLNGAFERLLDGLYEEKAWDISSDISVLHSMLAQEGLTGNDFERR